MHAFVIVLVVLATAHAQDVSASFRFPKPELCQEDTPKLFPSQFNLHKRWHRHLDIPEHDLANMDEHEVVVKDVQRWHNITLKKFGFELVDLNPSVMPVIKEIGKKGILEAARVGPVMDDEDYSNAESIPPEEILARQLQGYQAFNVRDHFTFNLRCTGFVIRKGGPTGIGLKSAKHNKGFEMVAHRVHIDQDLEGKPLLSMGLSWAFSYIPFLDLLNVWVPLHDPRVRPLGMMDLYTLGESDVLRYRANSTKTAGGKIGSFESDRKMALHNDHQSWSWFSHMKLGQAILFYTGKTAHSSFSIPGEEVLAKLYQDLNVLLKSLEEPQESAVRQVCSRPVDALPDTVDYIKELTADSLNVRTDFCNLPVDDRPNMREKLETQLKSLTRTSLEIRCANLNVPHNVIPQLLIAFTTLTGLFGYVCCPCPGAPSKQKRKLE